MDYGPFGFLEEYDPLFAKWTGSGEHFVSAAEVSPTFSTSITHTNIYNSLRKGFLNQIGAGYANYQMLVESVVPVIAVARDAKDAAPIQAEFLERAGAIFQASVDKVFRQKLGFTKDQDVADGLWKTLESLMRNARADWTLTFRSLSYLVRDVEGLLDTDSSKEFDYDALLDQWIGEGDDSFLYEPLESGQKVEWKAFLKSWREALAVASEDQASVAEAMLKTNPKFILREWMLVQAYRDANEGKEAELFGLFDLIQRPYDEGTETETKRYYRRTPEESIMMGGTAFMS